MASPGATSDTETARAGALPLVYERLPALAALAADVSRSLGESGAAVLLYRHGHRLGRAMAAGRTDAPAPPPMIGVAAIDVDAESDGPTRRGRFTLGPDGLPIIRAAVAGYVAGFFAEREAAPRVCVETAPAAAGEPFTFVCGPPEALGEPGLARSGWHSPEAVPVAAGTEVLQARNESLARQSAELRAAFVARTEFLADVCHELRTPAGLILGSLEEILGGSGSGVDADLRERLRLVQKSAHRVRHLADSLLDLTGLGSGRTTLGFRPVALAPFLLGLAAVFRPGLEERGVGFDVILPAGLPPVPSDPDALEKVAGNLLANAMKFTPAGGRVTLRLRRYGGAQVIEVQDDGPGIAEADLPRLFDRYRRGRSAASAGGAGIGLALVKELMVRLGGEVQVHSTPGEGTTFRAFFAEDPAHADAGETVRAPAGDHAARLVDAELAGAQETPVAGGGRQRVLVVEDNAEVRQYLERLLGHSWDVDLAADGIEALERLETAPADLVLCDVMMPRMDGLTLVARLRESPSTRDLPVVLLTARGELEHRLRGFDAGADDFVVKPFAGKELVARLRVHLALRAAQAELRAYAGRLERLVDEQVGRIVEQNRSLARANRELEDFLTIASHDLKSPLVSIAGFTAILDDAVGDAGPPQVRLALDRIAFNVDWMQRLIEGLLSLASVRAVAAKRTAVDVAALLSKVEARMQPEVAAVGGRLERGDAAGRCLADPARLEEAIANLVENSVKYRKPGRPLRVLISARPSGDTVTIEVTDNGVGIAPDHHQKVFQPLFRSAGTAGQGAGLGLYIVRRIVEEAGGRVWVTSTPEVTTTMHLALPAAGAEEGRDARP